MFQMLLHVVTRLQWHGQHAVPPKQKHPMESNKRTGPNHLEIEIRRRVSYLVTSSSNMTYEITVSSHVLLAARVLSYHTQARGSVHQP